MDAARSAPAGFSGLLMKSLTKILRYRRGTGAVGGDVSPGDDEVRKVKLEFFDGSSIFTQSELAADDDEQKRHHLRSREDTEALLAELFASVSAIKASYAQLQVAQMPYDPEAIQSSDKAVVSELKRISHLKHSYLKKSTPLYFSRDSNLLAAEIHEQSNLLKTYQITTKKLEVELDGKDKEIISLREELQEADRASRSLEAKLKPKRSLSALDDLHFSGLNSTHFLILLRYTVKSIRSFVKVMTDRMEASGWDLTAAAMAIEPDVAQDRPEHRPFAFESYICRVMFSDFHRRDFGLAHDNQKSTTPSFDKNNNRRYFDEFTRLRYERPKQLLMEQQSSGKNQFGFGKFCRGKYLALVHPKMELSFFGDLEQRRMLESGEGAPATGFFLGYAEMARRVWLLHRLYFSFGPDVETSIYRAERGQRFSEVYMESVAAATASAGGHPPAVAFTVVPGFRVGKAVVQCKVYARW